MKKQNLKHHAEALAASYEEYLWTWSSIGLLYAAINTEKMPPKGMILDVLKKCWLELGEQGLVLTEFLDAYQESEIKK